MRVTKTLAEELAIKCTKKLKDAINEADKDIVDFCIELALSKTPKEILDILKTPMHKFIKTKSNFYVNYAGQSFWIDVKMQVPIGGDNLVITNSLDCDSLQKLINKRDDLVNKRRKIVKELEVAFLSLKTTNKVKEVFPEVSEFLEEQPIKAELMLNYQDTRNKLIELL